MIPNITIKKKHIHKFIDTHASSNSTRYTVWECECGARKLVDV